MARPREPKAPLAEAPEVATPQVLSADHLRQVELASAEIRVRDMELKLYDERLKTRRIVAKLAEADVTIATFEHAAILQARDEAKKRHSALLSSLKDSYQLTDRWAYHPETGAITREG